MRTIQKLSGIKTREEKNSMEIINVDFLGQEEYDVIQPFGPPIMCADTWSDGGTCPSAAGGGAPDPCPIDRIVCPWNWNL